MTARNPTLAEPFRSIVNAATPHVRPTADRNVYTMPACFPVRFTPAGCVEEERADVECEITFRYLPGRPAIGPRYDHGGLPADPPDVEFVSVKITDGDGIELTAQQAEDYATDWLSDDGFDQATEWVAEHEYDPTDDIRDRLIDDKLTA